MATPVFQGTIGTIATDLTGAASTTPGPPTHAADDILVAIAVNAGSADMSTATAGWNAIGSQIQGTARIFSWWKRATAAGTAGPTITASGTDQFAVCFVIRGCVNTGNPFEANANTGDGTTTDATPDTAGCTTIGTNRLVLAMCAIDGAATVSSGNPPAGWTNNANVNSASGTQARFIVSSIAQANPTTVNSVVLATLSAASRFGMITLAFRDAVSRTVSPAAALGLGTHPATVPTFALPPAAALGAGRANAPVVAARNASQLTDDFDDNSIDTAKWNTQTTSGATVAETSQCTRITIDNSDTNVTGILESNFGFYITGSEFKTNISSYPTQSANTRIRLKLSMVGYGYIILESINGTWKATIKDGVTITDYGTYAGTPAWVKISESAGTVHFWRSADGTSWTEIGTGGPTPGVTFGLLSVQFSHIGSDISSNTCDFDNFNVSPAVNVTISPAASLGAGRVDVATPVLSVTALALATGIGGPPTPKLEVTAVALAGGRANLPTVTTRPYAKVMIGA